MPLYRVEALSWIGGRTVRAGEEIEYSGVPGSKLTPLDDAAKQAKADATGRKNRPPAKPVGQKRTLVEIPADWETKQGIEIVGLARKLGAPIKGTTKESAVKFIKDEVARRATV